MKIVLTVFATFALAFSSLASAAFEDRYELNEYNQYVFDTESGSKYTIKLKEQTGAAVCSVSLNDGLGAFTFLLLPNKTTAFDAIFEDYEGNSDYELAYRIQCYRYSDEAKFTEKRVDLWKKSMGHVRSLLGASKTHHSGTKLEERLSDYLSIETFLDLDIEGQEVGSIERLSNTNKDRMYVCAINTSNTSHTLYLMAMPNTTHTFHSMAAKNGDWSADLNGCKSFTVGSYTMGEIKQYVNDL